MPNLDKHALYELDILQHVEHSSQLNNRAVSRKLGVSIKLAHEILKRMVQKGLLHVTVVNTRRWDYFLTPKGIAEKTRLTLEFFEFSMHFYREARRLSAKLCRDLAEAGKRRVAFLGAGDLAEIAYLGVQEWKLDLVAVYDDGQQGRQFMLAPVRPVRELYDLRVDAIIVCVYDARMPMRARYLPEGMQALDNMHWIFQQEPTAQGRPSPTRSVA